MDQCGYVWFMLGVFVQSAKVEHRDKQTNKTRPNKPTVVCISFTNNQTNKQGKSNEQEKQQFYQDKPISSALNTAGNIATNVAGFSQLAPTGAGLVQNVVAGLTQGAIQPADDLTDRAVNSAISGGAAGA